MVSKPVMLAAIMATMASVEGLEEVLPKPNPHMSLPTVVASDSERPPAPKRPHEPCFQGGMTSSEG